MARSINRPPANVDCPSEFVGPDIEYAKQADIGAASTFRTGVVPRGLHPVDSGVSGMRIMRRSHSGERTAIVAVALMLALSGIASAHTDAAPDAAAAQAPDATVRTVQPIFEGDVPARADTVSADLRRIERFIDPQPEIVRLESRLDLREAQVVSLLADLDSMADADVSTRRLTDQRIPWQEMGEALGHWSKTVQDRYSALQEQRERLRDERELWELTAQRALQDESAPELHRRIEAILVRIRDVETRVRARRNEVGAIHARITNMTEVGADSQVRLDAVTDALRRNAFDRGTEPLWRGLGAGSPTAWPAELASGSTYWWRAFRQWSALERLPLFGLTVFLIASFVAALRLRRIPDGAVEDDALSNRARALLKSPLMLAGLASTVVAPSVILLGSTPADLIYLLVCIALLRLRDPALAAPLRSVVPTLCALTVLVRISSLVPEGSSLERLLLTTVSGIAFVVFAGWAFRHRSIWRELAGFERFLAVLVPLAVVLPGVAFFAIVLGWEDLARILCLGAILSPTIGLAWAAAANSAEALTGRMIAGRLGEALPSLPRKRDAVMRTAGIAFTVIALISWSRSTFLHYQVLDLVSERWTEFADSHVGIGGLELSVGGLVSAAVVVLVTLIVSRFVRFVLMQEVAPRLTVDIGVTESIVSVSSYAVYGVGIALAASAAGLSGTHVAVVIGALSVGIGFGLQNIVSNFVSGLILIFERPIRIGDIVQTSEDWGRITSIGIRASTIRSFDGAELIVPNADLISKQVVNWTRSDKSRRVVVPIGVAYGNDPGEVLEILLRVASAHPFALKEPAPDAQMLGYGDSSLNFRVRVWTHMDHWIELSSDLNVNIGAALAEAGISIPFPQRDLHLKTVEAEAVRAVKSVEAEAPDSQPARTSAAVRASDQT